MIGGVFPLVYSFLLPSFDPSPDTRYVERIVRFDYVEAILSIWALVSPIMAINFGSTKYAWNSGQTIVLFCLCGVFFLVFAIQQKVAHFITIADSMFSIHFFQQGDTSSLHPHCGVQYCCIQTNLLNPCLFSIQKRRPGS